MAHEDAMHRCVTKFMLGTCHHQRSEYAEVLCLFSCATRIAGIDVDVFASGSSAELLVKPMLSCVGDFDVMFAANNSIAIPRGHTPPTELPSHYECTVYALEIIDSHQPGFVYLRILYKLTKNDNGRYVAERIENNETAFCEMHTMVTTPMKYNWLEIQPRMNRELRNNRSVQSLLNPSAVAHGPAIKSAMHNKMFNDIYKPAHFRFSHLNWDYVNCIRCLHWPILAASWPSRNRNHGWPEQTTINEVVINGCDVVAAVHPRCRQDEWMNRHQSRLSFSRAEVKLLNSWTKVQQIIYHMLRYVTKREVLSTTDDSDPDFPKLSNYHIKTLMLWECEQKPQSWWSAESSLMQLAVT